MQRLIDLNAPPTTFNMPPATVHDGTPNLPAATTLAKVFLCPADAIVGRVPGSDFAGTNYAGNAGSGIDSGNLATADGVFFLGSKVGFQDITDGTSQTVAFSERNLGIGGTVPPSGSIAAQKSMREIGASVTPTQATCDPSSSGGWNQERGAKWILGNYGNTLYNHALPPNSKTCDCLNATQQKGRLAARSYHPGGVLTVRCDGSVHFASEGVAEVPWQALATRGGREVTAE